MAASLSPPPLGGADTSYRVRRPIGPRLLGAVGLAAILAGIWWAAHQQSTVTRKAAEDSVLIPVTPPPPPPPPPEVKPEPKPQEVPPQPTPNQPQPANQPPTPQPQSAAPSAGQAVAIDGPPQAGGDGFNIGSGSGGGMRGAGGIGNALGGFNRAAYATYLEGEIRRAVEASKDLRTAALRARARVWIDPSGRVSRIELGDIDKAAAIRAALTGRTLRAPDPSLAMPVVLDLDLRRPG